MVAQNGQGLHSAATDHMPTANHNYAVPTIFVPTALHAASIFMTRLLFRNHAAGIKIGARRRSGGHFLGESSLRDKIRWNSEPRNVFFLLESDSSKQHRD